MQDTSLPTNSVRSHRIPVSVLLLTFNEEQNLPRCLEALGWCDDIVVLDSYSTDATTRIAEAAGARVVQREFDCFAAQRNWAIDNVPFQHDWVLHLDADEVCTPELQAEIAGTIDNPRYDAYRIPSKMIFLGKWLRFAAIYPSYQVRLGRRELLRFRQVGHGQREDISESRIGTMSRPYLHYSFSKGLEDWFAKHNRYSTAEAAQLATGNGAAVDLVGLLAWPNPTRRRRAVKTLANRLPFRPTLRFIYMYVCRFGFLDRLAGYHYCRLLAIYQAMIDMKVLERRRWPQDTPGLSPFSSSRPYPPRTAVSGPSEVVAASRVGAVSEERP